MRGRGPSPWPAGRRGSRELVAGLLIGLLILAVLAWVIGTWPRPGPPDQRPRVPTAPAP